MRKQWLILLMALVCWPLTIGAYTVVLDAGHGGKDPGAVGKFSKEKDLNLSLVLQIGKLIKEQYPDVTIVYTRSTDVFIPLQTRADIANKNNADLFISIHANSSESREPKGVETFILGTDRMEANLDVAMRENAVMKLEADYKTTYQGFDPNSIDSYIMFELMQNSYMDQSLQFAEKVQQHFVGRLNRSDRGVRQAAFWVLLKTACPSILFEMGFISNPDEEKFLNNSGSMTKMAQAIVDAFGAYTHKQAVRREQTESGAQLAETTPQPAEFAPKPAELTPQPAKEEKPAVEQKPVVEQTQVEITEVLPPTETWFAVQVCASRKPLAPDDPKLKGQKCECMHLGDWYKYYTAADTDRAKVVQAQKELKPLFPDCWVITFDR